MKVIIYMSITPNGYIASSRSGTDFIQSASDRGFRRMMSQVKANVVGTGTYKKSLESGHFPYKGLNVVMTRKPVKSRWKNVIFTDKGPAEVLELFRKEGYRRVMVGGGKINSLFMKAKLVDEIYLDVQPSVFTEGVRVFDGPDFDAKLRLIGVKRLSRSEVQLHYKVLKKGHPQK
ncbi:MAG: dihydrofolate reductase family protein [Candidatus Micrarchaeota archaeon]|nr:dihydrofolate reductase family protein [Candidatus Micrarchaeota archaeon]